MKSYSKVGVYLFTALSLKHVLNRSLWFTVYNKNLFQKVLYFYGTNVLILVFTDIAGRKVIHILDNQSPEKLLDYIREEYKK